MKRILIVISLFTVTRALADLPCNKCDIEKVKVVQEHLDSLTFDIVNEFLCTFDSSCKLNVEYSEASNGTLFTVLEFTPQIYFQVLAKGQVNSRLLLKEIESPIHDLIDLQKIYEKIKMVSAPQEIKTKYLNALVIAANKTGKTIIK